MTKYIGYFTSKSNDSSSEIVFWTPLISYFIKRATHFRIDCWANEHEVIESAIQFGKLMPIEMDHIRTIEGIVTSNYIDEIISNPYNSEYRIKYFSIFLKNNDQMILSIEHNGNEYITGWLDEQDIHFLKKLSISDLCFHTYNEKNEYLRTVNSSEV